MSSVLIWKKESTVGEKLSSILSNHGHTVRLIQAEADTLSTLHHDSVDLAIIDLDLDLLQRLQGDFPLIPILVIGKNESSSEAIAIVQAGGF